MGRFANLALGLAAALLATAAPRADADIAAFNAAMGRGDVKAAAAEAAAIWPEWDKSDPVAACFLGRRGPFTRGQHDYHDKMADQHDALVADIMAPENEALRGQLSKLKWRAETWTRAIESLMLSAYVQIGSNIDTRLKPRDLAVPGVRQYAETAANAALPVCAGEFEGRKLRYPASAEYAEMVGAVVVRVETVEQGAVVESEVLAAVPAESFGETVKETVATWRFVPEKGGDAGACRVNSRNRTITAVFQIS